MDVNAQIQNESQLIQRISKTSNVSDKFKLELELFQLYLSTDLEKANRKLAELKSKKNKDLAALVSLAELRYYLQIKDFSSFQNTTNSMNISVFKDFSTKIEYLTIVGAFTREKQDFIRAIALHKQALSFSKKVRNNYLIADIYRNIGLDFAYLDKKDSALFYSNRSITLARKTNAQSGILTECFNSQALIYRHFNQIDIGIAKNILALEISQNTAHFEKLSRLNREIGISQLDIQNWNEAEVYFNNSLSFARKLKDNSQIALALINLAAVEHGRKNYIKSKQIAREAETYLTKITDTESVGDIENFIGILYNDLGDYKEAAIRLNKALVNFESIGNRLKIANVYHHVGKVLLAQGKFIEAENFLNRSITIQKELQKIGLIHLSYKVLSDLYLKKNNVSEAYKYLTFYVQYLDSNNMLQSARSIAELNETFKTQEQLQTINLQSDSIKRAKEKQDLTNSKLENTQLRNMYQLLIIIFILILIVAGGLILKNYWNRTKLVQLQRETEMSQTLLRSQMNPHFIFNAMTVIQSYIYDNDPSKSSKFLVNFSRLMRLILENSSKEFISLETEVEILQKYLTTQKLRFEDRFDFEVTVNHDLSTSETMIPPMITQPFIENSIEHGQLHTVDGGFIKINFSAINNMMHIEISDNGIGRKQASKNKKSKEHHSMALKITEERISILNRKYMTNGKLEIADFNKINETGTIVDIEIPLKFKNQLTEV
ncbi:MAG: tetratricopeptide repeat protein [Bacteroidota bacterium]